VVGGQWLAISNSGSALSLLKRIEDHTVIVKRKEGFAGAPRS
jgi:hypothetical protein